MYGSGFDGRRVKLVWDALFCVLGGVLGTACPHYIQMATVVLQAAWLSGNPECRCPVMQLSVISTAVPLLSGL